ncbi:MAG TPA: hypothetical protein VGM42_12325 [Rhodopila sp.]
MANSRTLHRPPTTNHHGIAASIAHAIGTWRTRIRDRQTFATLDRRDLHDLSLSQWEVERELAKPFWRD